MSNYSHSSYSYASNDSVYAHANIQIYISIYKALTCLCDLGF